MLRRYAQVKIRTEELTQSEHADVAYAAAHVAMRRAKLLIGMGGREPTSEHNDSLVRELRSCARLCPPSKGKKTPLGDAARELLVGLHARRQEYGPAAEAGAALHKSLLASKPSGLEAEALTVAHATRTAHLHYLNTDHATALKLYEPVLAAPKRVGAMVWLRAASCTMHLGRTQRRSAQHNLTTAYKLARKHAEGAAGSSIGFEDADDGNASEASFINAAASSGGGRPGSAASSGPTPGALLTSSGEDAMGGMGLSREQLWVNRYALGLMLQQDGATAQAIGHFDALLGEMFERIPSKAYRIAALTGLASCLTQLHRQARAKHARPCASLRNLPRLHAFV